MFRSSIALAIFAILLNPAYSTADTPAQTKLKQQRGVEVMQQLGRKKKVIMILPDPDGEGTCIYEEYPDTDEACLNCGNIDGSSTTICEPCYGGCAHNQQGQ